MQETWVQSLGQEDLLVKGMAPHSSILSWRIPWTRGPWWATIHRVTKMLNMTYWTWLSWICCCLDLTTKQLSLYTEQNVQHYLWSLWINIFTIYGDWFLNWSSFHQLGGARKKRWSRQTLGKICSSPSVSPKCFHQSPYKWDLTTHISCPVPLVNGKIILCKQLAGNKMLKTVPNCSHTSSFPSSK